MDTREKDREMIRRIVDEERRKYAGSGGDIEFVDIQDKTVRIRPTGFCWR
ncbi:MAG: NifU family protein [Nitrospirae bacterium]|nr:NifU family protein [Nitrospirota bacterium]